MPPSLIASSLVREEEAKQRMDAIRQSKREKRPWLEATVTDKIMATTTSEHMQTANSNQEKST
jgi:hypothetical protein